MTREYFLKYVLTPVLGFGLGGALWGWQAYSLIDSGKIHASPFSYILGAVFLGVLGSGSLVLFSGDWKKILRVIGLGTVGWVVAFVVPRIFEYWLWLGGGLFLAMTISPIESFSGETLANYFIRFMSLKPNLQIANFFIEFLLIGIIVGMLYYFVFKAKMIRTILFGALGFAMASIVSPIFGNIAGNIVGSLFASYLVTFSLIGIIFGFALVWGLRNYAEVQSKNKT